MIWRAVAPSALRMPNSRSRRATWSASRPYKPTAARTSPTIPNDETRTKMNRSVVRERVAASCSDRKLYAARFAVARVSDRFHITDNADNREPRASSIESSPANAFPDRRIVRPKTFRDALADNADQRCVGSVARVEIAALKNRLADALEIPGHGQARVRGVDSARLRCGRLLGVEQHQCPRRVHWRR